ncbi:GNAT family N-acetyltransferase [Microbulbifer aggregans]|uniref:GNAT family N-acetyltransferase n=1 Tax=Microbulbifer aggregans TaxID=1769779 RepID=UPI001CFC9B27|nr:GNAT family N-acetyltransferase [Microbulbifer aggregans]
MNIEPATMEDLEEILNLQKITYESEAVLNDDLNIPPLNQTLQELKKEFLSGLTLLKHCEDNTIVASVRAHESDGICHIGRLIVSPDRQGRGIGSNLLRYIEGAFIHCQEFHLFTGIKSERNIKLYNNHGYSQVEMDDKLVHMVKTMKI